MFVEPADYRPLSTLTPRPVDVFQLIGGVGTAVAVYAFFGVLASILTLATGRTILDARAIGEEPPVPEENEPEVLVEAGFVQLGQEWDPRELPDRAIQSDFQQARAQDPNVVSPFQRLLDPDAGPRPTSTALQAIVGQQYEEEGEATYAFLQEGEAHGSETPREGDMVLGQLHSMIRRGLEVPPNLAESEYASTRARVCTTIDASWSVSSIRFVGSSGNEDWDRAVRRRVDEIAGSRPSITSQPGQVLPREDCINVVPIAGRRRRPAGTSGSSALDNLLGN